MVDNQNRTGGSPIDAARIRDQSADCRWPVLDVHDDGVERHPGQVGAGERRARRVQRCNLARNSERQQRLAHEGTLLKAIGDKQYPVHGAIKASIQHGARRGLRRQHQASHEGRAAPESALHLDVAAHGLRETSRDGKAKPRAAALSANGIVCLLELGKQVVDLAGSNSNARVGHLDLEA
jgi:hypothetical protein